MDPTGWGGTTAGGHAVKPGVVAGGPGISPGVRCVPAQGGLAATVELGDINEGTLLLSRVPLSSVLYSAAASTACSKSREPSRTSRPVEEQVAVVDEPGQPVTPFPVGLVSDRRDLLRAGHGFGGGLRINSAASSNRVEQCESFRPRQSCCEGGPENHFTKSAQARSGSPLTAALEIVTPTVLQPATAEFALRDFATQIQHTTLNAAHTFRI